MEGICFPNTDPDPLSKYRSGAAFQIRIRIRFPSTDPDPLSKYGPGSAFKYGSGSAFQIRIRIRFPNTDPDPYLRQPIYADLDPAQDRKQPIKNPTVSGSAQLGVFICVPFGIYTPNDCNLFLLGIATLLIVGKTIQRAGLTFRLYPEPIKYLNSSNVHSSSYYSQGVLSPG
jgi:hypothetical protein